MNHTYTMFVIRYCVIIVVLLVIQHLIARHYRKPKMSNEKTTRAPGDFPEPHTLEDAIKLVREYLEQNPESMTSLRATLVAAPSDLERSTLDMAVDHLISMSHHEFGMYLRNELNLWAPETPVVQWCADALGVAMADDLSTLILDGVFSDVAGIPRHTDLIVARSKAHWKEENCDMWGHAL